MAREIFARGILMRMRNGDVTYGFYHVVVGIIRQWVLKII
jgi:hypothetical protein